MTVAFPDTWVPNGPFPIVEGDDVRGGLKHADFDSSLAEGHIQCVAESAITDGDTFVLNDGVNPAVTFEFDTNSSVIETPTLRQVALAGGETAEQVAQLIITAVAGAPTLDITASSAGIGVVALVKDNASGAGVPITQGGTSPLTVFGMAQDDGTAAGIDLMVQAAALNVVPPSLRQTGMIVSLFDGNSSTYSVRWTGSTFVNNRFVQAGTSGIPSFAEDSAVVWVNGDKIHADVNRLFVSGSGNTRELVHLSQQIASQASAYTTRGRTTGNANISISLFAGQFEDYGDVTGIHLDENIPTFIIGEDTGNVGSADIAEIFGVSLPVAGDGTQSEFHFYALEGATPAGLELNVDSGTNLVHLIQQMANAEFRIENAATTNNRIVLRTTAVQSQTRIESGASDFAEAIFREGSARPGLFSASIFHEGGEDLSSLLFDSPAQAGQAAIAGYIDRDNSAVTFDNDKGVLWVGNGDTTTGAYSQITFQAGDEFGSYPHWHLFCEKRVASVDALQEFGWAVSDGLGGSYNGDKLFWFEGGNTISMGGPAAGEFSDLSAFAVNLTESTGSVRPSLRFDNGGGDGHLAVEGGNGGDADVAYFASNETETLSAASSFTPVAIVVHNTDSLHDGGFIKFSGETGATDDDAISTGIAQTAFDNFDAIKVQVGGNVRWLRAYLTRDPA